MSKKAYTFSYSYAEVLYHPAKFRKALTEAVKALKPELSRFDSIVVRGASGVAFGGALSVRLNKPMFIVRKPSDKSHEGVSTLVTGNGEPKRWLFVDDFVSSGETLRICKDAIGPGYVGKYTYTPGRSDSGVRWEK